MKLEKAIEILEDYLRDCFTTATSDHAMAVKLGIEALQHILSTRGAPSLMSTIKLPSETED